MVPAERDALPDKFSNRSPRLAANPRAHSPDFQRLASESVRHRELSKVHGLARESGYIIVVRTLVSCRHDAWNESLMIIRRNDARLSDVVRVFGCTSRDVHTHIPFDVIVIFSRVEWSE